MKIRRSYYPLIKKKYLFLCAKAKEIQELWHPCEGDMCWHKCDEVSKFNDEVKPDIARSGLGNPYSIVNAVSFDDEGLSASVRSELVWLPRSEQLMEMLNEEMIYWKYIYQSSRIRPHVVVLDFNERTDDNIREFDSVDLNLALLQAVMWMLSKKVLVDDEWVLGEQAERQKNIEKGKYQECCSICEQPTHSIFISYEGEEGQRKEERRKFYCEKCVEKIITGNEWDRIKEELYDFIIIKPKAYVYDLQHIVLTSWSETFQEEYTTVRTLYAMGLGEVLEMLQGRSYHDPSEDDEKNKRIYIDKMKYGIVDLEYLKWHLRKLVREKQRSAEWKKDFAERDLDNYWDRSILRQIGDIEDEDYEEDEKKEEQKEQKEQEEQETE